MESKVFISHRSTDKEVAEMLLDFLAGTGIPKEQIFCSSLPGNDIGSRISAEVKDALKNSALNIAILSHDYYQSAYCLNEAGILWYVDIPVIAIAMPEITESNMRGFLNSEYKLRRLDSETDISYIYDAVRKETASEQKSVSIITRENEKLRRRYEAYLETRKSAVNVPASGKIDSFAEELTDDEQIVLYYMLKKQVRRVSKSHISEWLNESEIHNVNVDNAFDFLSDSNGEISSDGTFSLSVDTFRKGRDAPRKIGRAVRIKTRTPESNLDSGVLIFQCVMKPTPAFVRVNATLRFVRLNAMVGLHLLLQMKLLVFLRKNR